MEKDGCITLHTLVLYCSNVLHLINRTHLDSLMPCLKGKAKNRRTLLARKAAAKRKETRDNDRNVKDEKSHNRHRTAPCLKSRTRTN